MRRNKNITLESKNITSHFTGKEKIITLSLIIIMLSFANITFTSALSYQSNVGIGFTFNPTLSVNISPSDLVISNLVPGSTLDSNVINVSVASNASYGYTLSAIMNGNNNDLAHTNGTDVFSSIATNSSLPSLTTNNTWGYNYKLSNDTNWNNYSGLSTETSKTLVDSNGQTAMPIDFKIAAKAGNTQPSGTYTNTINFIAVSKVAPMSLLDSFIASGAEQLNGYYKMQDMTTEICSAVEEIPSSLQVIDIRDGEIYRIAKLLDNRCWLLDNLRLDPTISSLDATNTNATAYVINNYKNGGNPDSLPGYSSIAARTASTGLNTATEPVANITYINDISNDTLDIAGGWKIGGYYNFCAATMGTYCYGYGSGWDGGNTQYDICPANWRMPTASSSQRESEYSNLYNIYNSYYEYRNALRLPLSGSFLGNSPDGQNNYGKFLSSSIANVFSVFDLEASTNNIDFNISKRIGGGQSVRCIAK